MLLSFCLFYALVSCNALTFKTDCSLVKCADIKCAKPVYPPGVCCPRCCYDKVTNGYYNAGDAVPRSDFCVRCYCTDTGEVVCKKASCLKLPCSNPISVTGQCCPTCPEMCVDSDGTAYKLGAEVPSADPCTKCKCSDYGKILCATKTCLPVDCENPVKRNGECCPYCIDSCVHEGITYKSGEMIATGDPCKVCVCKEGTVACKEVACEVLDCDKPIRHPDKCCPSCPEQCVGYDGTVYYPGQEVRTNDPCTHCKCSEDGAIICGKVRCPLLTCSNSIQKRGECCATCGETCLYDGIEYKVGDTIRMSNPCKKCRCEDGGKLVCVAMLCTKPQCTSPVYHPDECCPTCPTTCFNKPDGRTYKSGEVIPSDDTCKQFYCDQGDIVCRSLECPNLRCANPVYEKGVCCPTCPDTCFNEPDGITYKVGEKVPNADPCLTCSCVRSDVILCSERSCNMCPYGIKAMPQPSECCPTCLDCTNVFCATIIKCRDGTRPVRKAGECCPSCH